MAAIRSVRPDDLDAFRRLHNEYVDRAVPPVRIRHWYRTNPALLLGAYEDGELVGHCLGLPWDDAVVELDGIAVEQSHQRRGIGSALLDGFEDRVGSQGFERVTLGSAGGYVDEFYLENGYAPDRVLVRLEPSADVAPYRNRGYDIVNVTREDGVQKVYVDVDRFDPEELTTIRAVFDDPDAIYIMEKDVR